MICERTVIPPAHALQHIPALRLPRKPRVRFSLGSILISPDFAIRRSKEPDARESIRVVGIISPIKWSFTARQTVAKTSY